MSTRRSHMNAHERLLARLVASGGSLFVNGADVRAARRLQAVGVATLTDNGPLGRGRGAGCERWLVRHTPSAAEREAP